jgi:endoglucanase
MLESDRATKAYSYEDLVIDAGISAERLRELVSVGDFVTFRQPVRKLLNRRAAGKSFDNRASVAAVTVALDYLQAREHGWDVIAVATVQEEVGLKGAIVTGFAEAPDVAVAIDVTHGKGPGAKDSGTLEIGGGPTLDLGPNVHPGMYKSLKETAEALEMKVQVGTHSRASGTDAYALQIARAGIPTGLVSLPLRYMHTMVETVSLKDVKRTGRLLGEFAARLEDDFLQQLAESMLKAD